MIKSDYNQYLQYNKVSKVTIEEVQDTKFTTLLYRTHTLSRGFPGISIFYGFDYITVKVNSGTLKKLKYVEYKRLEDGKTNKREDPSIGSRIRSLVSLFRNKH